MKNFLLLCLALVGLSLAACKRTVEGEKTSYEANRKTLEKLGAEFPGFKPAFEAMLAEGETAWKAAEGVSGEEAQIKAMAAVNAQLAPSFVRDLSSLRDQLNKLKDLKTSSVKLVTKEEDKTALMAALDELNISLNRVEGEMKTSRGTSRNEVQAVVEGWMKDIKAAQNRVDNIVKPYREAANEKQDEKDLKELEKLEQAKAVKCKKCGTKCEADKGDCSKCGSCGAPLG